MDTKIFIYCIIGYVAVKYWTKYDLWETIKSYFFSIESKSLTYFFVFILIVSLIKISGFGGKKLSEKLSKKKT
ncbi:MAG: hypothetical protein ABF289_18645 [Clostridiales bacterium]